MNESKISTRYAKALYNLAREKNLINRIVEDNIEIAKIIDNVTEFGELLDNPVITNTKKKEIFRLIFKSLDKITLDFLDLLIENNRESYLKDITRVFLDLYYKGAGIRKVTLVTAKTTDSSTKEKILQILKNQIGDKIELTEVIDEKVIGGFILRIDDKQIDRSIATQLQKIRQQIIEK